MVTMSIPVHPIDGDWNTLADAPAVQGVREALADWVAAAGPLDADEPYDIPAYVLAQTQPIDNLITSLGTRLPQCMMLERRIPLLCQI